MTEYKDRILFATHLNKTDDAELIEWLESFRRTEVKGVPRRGPSMSGTIRDALYAYYRRENPDWNDALARAFIALLDKLQTAGVSQAEIETAAAESGIHGDMLASLRQHVFGNDD